MEFYAKPFNYAASYFGTSLNNGLSRESLDVNAKKFGYNSLTKKKTGGIFSKILEALREPMLIILIFSFIIAFGTCVGKLLRTGEGDFTECFGILAAIILSVSITLIMEGSSKKAFESLSRIYDNVSVKVIREGRVIVVNQQSVVVGDIILLESGDKIIADGRLIESNYLSIDESALTGESHSGQKEASAVLAVGTPLAERKNCAYSGSFVRSGNGKMLVTATGDYTEIGKIAGELSDKGAKDSPLQQKLASLGKVITVIGAVTSAIVFLISAIKLYIVGGFNFESVQELFISSIILIVAAVPEGLPTIVAVSLALNMIKLAKENALIKKMVATETAGAVSVICSDKTGTLTLNQMTVTKVCLGEYCGTGAKDGVFIKHNFILNSTAQQLGKNKGYTGSGTECALLSYSVKNDRGLSVAEYREKFPIINRLPFSGEKKYMITCVQDGERFIHLLKGAPEKVVYACKLTDGQRSKLLSDMQKYQKKSGRILCFAHLEKGDGELAYEGYTYDGFAVISDPVRPEVKSAVKACKTAGIKVKILTGDNALTALAVGREVGIASSPSEVLTASDVDKMDDATLKKVLEKVTVVARSTPIIKLRIVKLLKEQGEVVAVTGDGINDAPAIKNADIGIAMGVTGSEITKEAADVILLDDSFATIVKAISFGRNVYRNLQRFIIFQLSVNLCALTFITVCAVVGAEPPFNTLQLLWINVIMDGPPAITLGLERSDGRVMSYKPVARSESIISAKMLARIIISGLFMAAVISLQYFYDFLGAGLENGKSTAFTLFVFFQLFNAFNCRELGKNSILKRFGTNKVMVVTFAAVLILHIFIVQVLPKPFGVLPMSLALWIKCFFTAFSVIVFSELYKLVYRFIKSE